VPSSSSPSSSNVKSERTEVLYATENITNAILNFLSSVESKMDIAEIPHGHL